MSRKKEAIFMGIGILAGLALSDPAAQAATEVLTASPTSQTFYLNGQKVEFEAYSIHDNNFVKLRDIAQAVDFSVTYNAATNSVYIDPDALYQEEAALYPYSQRQPSRRPSGHSGMSTQPALCTASFSARTATVPTAWLPTTARVGQPCAATPPSVPSHGSE